WLAYSPDGVLGLMWRSNLPGPGPTFRFNVWAATSNDGGGTFSKPLKISTAPSPAPDPTVTIAGIDVADDFSYITLDQQYAYIGWADWRPGDRSGFFSRVDLRAFKHPRG